MIHERKVAWPLAGLKLCVALITVILRLQTAGAGEQLTVIRDLATLPEPVQTMRQAILDAARKGDIEELRYAIELNEMPPMIGPAAAGEPLPYLKTISVDGAGAETLARLSLLLEAPCAVVTGKDGAVMYVWPSYAASQLMDLPPADRVELYRLLPPDKAKAMLAKGEYSGWRLGISGSGIWHYLEMPDASNTSLHQP